MWKKVLRFLFFCTHFIKLLFVNNFTYDPEQTTMVATEIPQKKNWLYQYEQQYEETDAKKLSWFSKIFLRNKYILVWLQNDPFCYVFIF